MNAYFASYRALLSIGALLAVVPFLGGAQGDGCGTLNSRSPAPNMTGDWAMNYDDSLSVKISLGGKVYDKTLDAAGGTLTVNHEGKSLTFNLDCTRPEVVCPSEVWPATIAVTQRSAEFPHRMFALLPTQSCSGATVAADPAECGAGTRNPDCDDICDGDITTGTTERFGLINEPGTAFTVLLGAGVASNGVNCALLGLSGAEANITSTGGPLGASWEATEMTSGRVVTGYAGGCLWAGDPDDDGTLEALVLAASVQFETGFTGVRSRGL